MHRVAGSSGRQYLLSDQVGSGLIPAKSVIILRKILQLRFIDSDAANKVDSRSLIMIKII